MCEMIKSKVNQNRWDTSFFLSSINLLVSWFGDIPIRLW